MLQPFGAALGANLGEVHIEPQPAPQGTHRGDRPDRTGIVGDERLDVKVLAVQVALQGGDDARQLTRLTQRADLAEAQQRAMTGPRTVAHGLHQGHILVALVAPLTSCRLHEHTSNHTS